MIIITKAPNEIKRFSEAAQQIIQSIYAQNCFLLEQMILNTGMVCSQTGSPVTLVLSSNERTFQADRNYSVRLRIYQLRSKQKHSSEDILIEPFYPGFQTTLMDIYGILRESPRFFGIESYRYSGTHSPRMRRDVRDRFRMVLPGWFSHGVLDIETFDAFYYRLHQLDPSQLQEIFRAFIFFIKLPET